MKPLKLILSIVGAVLVLIIAAAILVPALVDVNDYKEKFEQLAEDSIGRKVSIEGELELNIFPFLRINTGVLTLANPPGYPHPDMIRVENADVGIRLLPLLFRKIEAGTIRIERPVINLTRKSTGEENWDFTRPGEKSGANGSGSTPAAFALQGIEISKAEISYIDLGTDTLVQAENLTLSTGSIVPGEDFPVSISSAVHVSMLDAPLELKIRADAGINLGMTAFSVRNLDTDIQSGQSEYEISSPGLVYDLDNGLVSAGKINVSTSVNESGKANLNVASLEFDTAQSTLHLENIRGEYTDGDLKAALALPGLGFDPGIRQARISSVSISAVSGEITLDLALPDTVLDLSGSSMGINQLSGNLHAGKLDVNLDFPRISLDRETMEFSVQDALLEAAGSQARADIHGTLAPLTAGFRVDTNGLNPAQFLEVAGSGPGYASENALASLDLLVEGEYIDNLLDIATISGQLDETTIEGNASMRDVNNPLYSIELALGEIDIDRYLPATAAQEDAGATAQQNASRAASTPLALSQLNLDANITIQRIYSKNRNFALEDLRLELTQDGTATEISLAGLASGEALPEPLKVAVHTAPAVDLENQNASLDNLLISATGKSISALLAVPTAEIPFSFQDASVDDISLDFAINNNSARLLIPKLSWNAERSAIVARNISGTGSAGRINADILLPSLTLLADSQHLNLSELAVDLNGLKPVGRLSIPALDFNLAEKSFASTNIDFEGQDGRASLDIGPGNSPGNYAGSVITNSFNLRGMLNRVGIMTDLEDSSALTRFDFKSPLRYNGKQIGLDKIRARIDDTNVNGTFEVQMSENPVYRFSLALDKLTADRYLATTSTAKVETGTTANVAGTPIEIPTGLIRKTRADGKVHVNDFMIAGARLTDLDVGIVCRDGKLSVSPLHSGFYGGAMDGELAMDVTGAEPVLDFDYQINGVSLNPALDSLGITDKLSGNGNFSLNLRATGATDAAMLNSANGAAAIEVRDGAITGVDIQDVLLQGYKAYASLAGKTVDSAFDPGEQTEFSTLTGNWKISRGIVSGNDLSIQAPLFRIKGQGDVSLPGKSIDYLLNVKVVESFEGQGGVSADKLKGRTIPLVVSGALSDPKFSLDITRLAQAEFQEKAEDKLREKIEDQLGEELDSGGSLQDQLQKKAIEKIGDKLLDLFN